jgi:hypothetical protein
MGEDVPITSLIVVIGQTLMQTCTNENIRDSRIGCTTGGISVTGVSKTINHNLGTRSVAIQCERIVKIVIKD